MAFTGVANLLTEKTRVLLYLLVDIGHKGLLGKKSVLFGTKLYWLACCVIEGYVNPKGIVALRYSFFSVAPGPYGFTGCSMLRITIWCVEF